MPKPTETWLREPPTARQRRNDAVLGVVLAGLSVVFIELQHSFMSGADLGWRNTEAYLWAAGLGLVLCVRRTFPLTVLVLSSLLFFGIGHRLPLLGTSPFVQIALFMAIYAAWAWSRRRLSLRWVSALVVIGMFGWVFWQIYHEDAVAGRPKTGLLEPAIAVTAYQIGINVIYFFGAIAWGIASWRGARQREELLDRTERLRREQEANARRAVADERVRIARDLHDVVAHHVSSIGVHAAGARRMLDREPAASSEALRTIENSSRTAVSEMHQLVGLLRTDADTADGERSSQPGLHELGALTESFGDERLRVELREVGERFSVADTMGLSLYRAAQEALSNVREHSTATSVAVVLRYLELLDGRAVEIEIIDNGSAVASRGRRNERESGGWGLQGIRERAGMHGGETEIGPRPSGGFRVRMRLPVVREP